MRGAPPMGFAVAMSDESLDLGVDGRATSGACGQRGESSTRGSDAAAIAGRCPGSRSRGTASTRPRPWPVRPRKAGPSYEAWAESPFACRRRAVGAKPGSRGRAGGGPRRGRGGAETGGVREQSSSEDSPRIGVGRSSPWLPDRVLARGRARHPYRGAGGRGRRGDGAAGPSGTGEDGVTRFRGRRRCSPRAICSVGSARTVRRAGVAWPTTTTDRISDQDRTAIHASRSARPAGMSRDPSFRRAGEAHETGASADKVIDSSDEIGYLPIDRAGADLFLQLISGRYKRGPSSSRTTRTSAAGGGRPSATVGSGAWGGPASESGRLRHGDGATGGVPVPGGW